jgi:Cft2 family RNA processing exonuclease
MDSWKDFINVRNDGSISLNPILACDGGTIDREILHVVTHAHTDHFKPSKVVDTYNKNGTVLMTELTRRLLSYSPITLGENYLGLKIVNPGEPLKIEGLDIKFIENNHILGSVQVEVKDYEKNISTGYSGDFNSEIIEFVDVDYLVVDATYNGDISQNRQWTKQEAEDELLQRINEDLNSGPVNLVADSGLLNLIVHKLNIKQSHELIIGKKEVAHFASVYDDTGYDQPKVVEKESEEAKTLYKKGKYLWIGNNLSDWPFDVPRGKTYIIKNFSPNNNKAITETARNENILRVSMTCHATQEEIYDYIRGVNPKAVVTDSSRNQNGSLSLAKNIRSKLKLPAYASSVL